MQRTIQSNTTEIGRRLQHETTAITLYDLLGYLDGKYPNFYGAQQQDPSECLYHLLEQLNMVNATENGKKIIQEISYDSGNDTGLINKMSNVRANYIVLTINRIDDDGTKIATRVGYAEKYNNYHLKAVIIHIGTQC